MTFLVTTRDVWDIFGTQIETGFSGTKPKVLYLKGGEANKRFEDVERLAEEMVRAGADRSSVVIALGGGIVNDMAGFLAAIFMRGVPVIQVPTTLLAQVDAAVGGKTAVNLRSGKNLIGSFHPPLSVVIDPDTLATLPEKEYRSGLFEVVKHGIIADPELFEFLEKQRNSVLARQPESVDRVIIDSVRIKTEVVSSDEKEGDLRRILNFGHTFGHALESETNYERFLHGEAVSWGMTAATHLSHITGLLSAADRDRILRVIDLYGPIPSLQGLSAENLFGRLVHDKKTIQGKIHFVLADRIGHVVVKSGIPDADVREALKLALP